MKRSLCIALLWATLAVGTTAAAERPIVAVSYFDNNSPEAAHAPLAKGLADMLITDLSQVSALRIVERSRLDDVLGELKLQRSKYFDPKTAQKLGRGLGAAYILTGGYLVVGDTMRVDARVVRVATAEVIAAADVKGETAEFFALEKELVELLVGALEVKLDFATKTKLRRNQTQSFAAWQQYSAGLAAQDAGDADAARRAFRAALAADPQYQAARTATERLQAIFAADDRDKADERRALIRGLDPKAPDFGARIDAIRAGIDRSDPVQVGQEVALLRHLVERDLAPPGQHGFSRVATNLLSWLSVYLADPSMESLIPQVCEYVVMRWPDNLMAKPQCKVYLKTIAAMQKVPRAHRLQSWQAAQAGATHDFDVARVRNADGLRRLFEACAAKAAAAR